MSQLRRLFDLACDAPVAERESVLRAAGASASAIDDVLALIDADAATQTRARRPLAALAAELIDTELRPGDVLGAWRLLRAIGSGGMGAVFLAERADGHFQQQGAVKLMRGRVDAAGAAGFARERQLLAGLQHPQIARLLDGGATPQGHPYLVMEVVDGAPIDRWCRERDSGMEARLVLFASICRTVHFAHQQLIAHCDLKPANILVRDDGVPVLLDFGVARTLAQERTATADPMVASAVDTASTPGRMTPRYASPEQLRGETPGIASDIHALGVVLYELVTGKSCERAADGRVPAPSASTSGVAWRGRLGGDLDAIVAQACAADPLQRYGSALALADDVARIALHRPVLARPQRPAYVLARLVRRRWPAFVVGGAMLLLAIGFTARTMQAEQRARLEADSAQRATDFLVSVFAASDSDVTPDTSHVLTAREVLDAGRARIDAELQGQPRIRARLLEALGNAYRHMELGAIAVPLLREAAAIHLDPAIGDIDSAARCLGAATNAMANGEFPAADTERVALQTLQLAQRVHGSDTQAVANAWMVLSLAYNRNARYELALQAARTTLEINARLLDSPDNRHSAALHNLGLILSNRGEFAQARAYAERALDLDPAPVTRSLRLRAYARTLQRLGETTAAIAAIEKAITLAASVHGDGGAFASEYRGILAGFLIERHELARADTVLARAMIDQRALNGDASGESITLSLVGARLALARGDIASAEAIARAALARRTAMYGDDDPSTLAAAVQLADALLAGDARGDEARALLERALAGLRARDAGASPATQHIVLQLARWHLRGGDAATARTLRDSAIAAQSRTAADDLPLLAELRTVLAATDGAAVSP
jgi:tetratricopeptide (TPR) repeat protein